MRMKYLNQEELDFIYRNSILTIEQINELVEANLITNSLFFHQPFNSYLFDLALKSNNSEGITFYIKNYLTKLSLEQLQNYFKQIKGYTARNTLREISEQKIKINQEILIEFAETNEKELTTEEVETSLFPFSKFNLNHLESSALLRILKRFTELAQFKLMPILDDCHLASYLSHKNKILRIRAKFLLEFEVSTEELDELSAWLLKNEQKENKTYLQFQELLKQIKPQPKLQPLQPWGGYPNLDWWYQPHPWQNINTAPQWVYISDSSTDLTIKPTVEGTISISPDQII